MSNYYQTPMEDMDGKAGEENVMPTARDYFGTITNSQADLDSHGSDTAHLGLDDFEPVRLDYPQAAWQSSLVPAEWQDQLPEFQQHAWQPGDSIPAHLGYNTRSPNRSSTNPPPLWTNMPGGASIFDSAQLGYGQTSPFEPAKEETLVEKEKRPCKKPRRRLGVTREADDGLEQVRSFNKANEEVPVHLDDFIRLANGESSFLRDRVKQEDHPGDDASKEKGPRLRPYGLDDDEDSEDTEDAMDANDATQQRWTINMLPNNSEPTMFGCLFFKFDPIRYRECLFRHSSTKTSYLKQHLGRHHMQPIHCPVCGDLFDTHRLRFEHIRKKACHARDFHLDGMTRSQQEMIQVVPRNRTPEERWFIMWDIIFPGKPRPASPFVGDPWIEVVQTHQQLLKKNHPEPASRQGIATPGGSSTNPFSSLATGTPANNLAMPEMQKAAVEQSRPQGSRTSWTSGPPISRQTDTRNDKRFSLYSESETSASAWVRAKALPVTGTHTTRPRGEGKVLEAEGEVLGAADGAPEVASGGSVNEDDRITNPADLVSSLPV